MRSVRQTSVSKTLGDLMREDDFLTRLMLDLRAYADKKSLF